MSLSPELVEHIDESLENLNKKRAQDSHRALKKAIEAAQNQDVVDDIKEAKKFTSWGVPSRAIEILKEVKDEHKPDSGETSGDQES